LKQRVAAQSLKNLCFRNSIRQNAAIYGGETNQAYLHLKVSAALGEAMKDAS
jgi:hypothetical protein